MASVGRRRVLYVHGFDPRDPGRYHDIQVQDVVVENARPDRRIDIGARRPGSLRSGSPESGALETAWNIDADWRGRAVRTDFVILRWDDLVRSRWDRTLPQQFRGLVDWFSTFVKAGYVADAARTSRTLLIAVLALPVAVAAYVAVLLVAALIAGAGVADLGRAAGWSPWWGLVGLGVLAAGPIGWRGLNRRLNLCWLGRAFRHVVDVSRDRIPDLSPRIDAFADRLIAAVDDPEWDEIVLAGHSAGSVHAVSALGRALGRRPDIANDPRLVLLTLGQFMPAGALLGLTGAQAADLSRVVASPVGWIDFTAPTDPGAMGGWHPLRHSAHADRLDRVKPRSPRFNRAMTPAAYRRLRRDPLAFHFQYLRPVDDPTIYDWFRLIAGPDRLIR